MGVQWDFIQDTFTFNIGDVSHHMEGSEPTKRNVVSMAAQFFDPLGVVSPVTVIFRLGCSTYQRSTERMESTACLAPRTRIFGDPSVLIQ